MTQNTRVDTFEQKYQALARASGVQAEEEAVAKFMFYAGIKFALKHATNAVPRVEASTEFPKIIPEMLDGNPAPKAEVISNNSLSVSQAQSLKDILGDVLHDLQTLEQGLKAAIKPMYQAADKDSVIGEYAFTILNIFRNRQRKVRATIEKLEPIQKQLKKISRG